jgi:hypothetical protein
MDISPNDARETRDNNPARNGMSNSMETCRRVCREHPMTVAAAGLAVAATLALVCVGLMRHNRW